MGKPLAASERSDYRALWQPDRVAMAKSLIFPAIVRLPPPEPRCHLFVLAHAGPFVTVPPALNRSRRSVRREHGWSAIPIFSFPFAMQRGLCLQLTC